MSKFLQAVKLAPLEFEGDTVTATLRPLDSVVFAKLLPFMQEGGAVAKELNEAAGRELTREELGKDPRVQAVGIKTQAALMPHIKEHVIEFKGLRDAAGAELSLDVALRTAYFIKVQSWLAEGLMGSMNLKESEAGESERPSGV